MKDFTFDSFFNAPLCWFVSNEGPKDSSEAVARKRDAKTSG